MEGGGLRTSRCASGRSALMARLYVTCPKCSHRNDRVGGRRTCTSCGATLRKFYGPKHDHARRLSHRFYADLQREVHGVNENECALCGGPAKNAGNLDRDHAHQDGGYPRGLLHPMCNKRLGEVERGQDAEQWLEAALAYVRRAREHHEAVSA